MNFWHSDVYDNIKALQALRKAQERLDAPDWGHGLTAGEADARYTAMETAVAWLRATGGPMGLATKSIHRKRVFEFIEHACTSPSDHHAGLELNGQRIAWF